MMHSLSCEVGCTGAGAEQLQALGWLVKEPAQSKSTGKSTVSGRSVCHCHLLKL